jgi:hypothetical protein
MTSETLCNSTLHDSRWKTTYHLRGLVIGFVGQSAISNTAEAALMTVLSFIWCIAAISLQGSPLKRLAAQPYR